MKRYAILARLGVGFMLLIFWGLVDSPLSGVVFTLALLALSAIRYRFGPYRWLGALEAAACAGYAFAWLPALLGLWLPIIGLFEDKWKRQEQELLHSDYEDRAERLKLEASREAAAQELQNAARLAELSERSRIAQGIHDHVGHEISGALIALQTAVKLYEKGDERTGDILGQSVQRLESALTHLRETVHNLKPSQTAGAETLAELCEAFRFCPVRFTVSGDVEGAVNWDLLAVSLKEALTNVSRHSNATLANVTLDGGGAFVRMTIADNGKPGEAPGLGLGLSGMKERLRAAGGTLTVNTSQGFQIVCILPKSRGKVGLDEAVNR